MTAGTLHPLADVLTAAADGTFPPADGGFDVFPPDAAGTHAVVELTGHSYVLTDRSRAELEARRAHGFGGCTHPDVLRFLAGPTGRIGSVDAVLVARGTGDHGRTLPEGDHLGDHHRVVRARAHRLDVRVFADERGLVTLGRGLAGRLEVSVELLAGATHGAGAGRDLVRAGLAAVGPGELVWAQVAPGNAASLRAFLACGFVPIGSEVVLAPGR